MKNKIFKFNIKNLIFASFFAILVLILSSVSGLWNPFLGLDNTITDGIYQSKTQADKNIHIVVIDESTIAKYGAYKATRYRQYFADALNALADNDKTPLVVGFDVIFNYDEDCDIVDQNLKDAMLRHNVVLGVNGANRSNAPYGLSEVIYSGASNIGYVDAVTDTDEAIRRTYLKGDNYNSLAYTIYESYCNKLGKTPTSYKNKEDYYFKYYAAPELSHTGDKIESSVMSGFDYIPLQDLIEGTATIRNSKESIVLFGSYASAADDGLSDDIYNSPIGEMFGIEVQCNVIQALLNDELYTKMNTPLYTIINTIIIFILVFLMSSFVFYLGFVIFGLSIGIEFLIMMFSHMGKSYYFISLPIFMLIIAFIVLIAMHYYTEYKHKKEVIGTFKRYISPDVAEALVAKEAEAISLGGRKRNVACLFVDIRGFTKMSEELNPEEVVDILNGYLEMATKQVFKYGGMVDKFIGDCVMAIFNAPLDLDDYVYKAVCAAYGIVSVGKSICDDVYKKYNKTLEFGVGVHFGDAVIGNIGSKTRMDFTAIGDTVNTASRIEASAGGHQVLISNDVYLALKDRIEVIDAGDRMFKNKKEPIKCYEVVSIKGYSDSED